MSWVSAMTVHTENAPALWEILWVSIIHMGTALFLSLIHISGVLDFFLDREVSFHTCIGVSAGACHACSFLSKQRRRGFETNTDYLEDEAYCSVKNLIKTGDLFGVDMCYRKIPEELNPYDYRAFDQNPTEFYVTAVSYTHLQPSIGDA